MEGIAVVWKSQKIAKYMKRQNCTGDREEMLERKLKLSAGEIHRDKRKYESEGSPKVKFVRSPKDLIM